MRVLQSPEEIASGLRAARSEARSAFGDDAVYVEKYLRNPRHIEFQILADRHGNAVHLGERDCSIQRRHQKLVEESPSPVVTPDDRERVGTLALQVARAARYEGAGTVEFLRDAEGAFYFLEMNTRLQVEHPVTEMVTGRDLVKLQILIAAGHPLPFGQEDVQIRGHSIECRILAEDPDRDFLPSPGVITSVRVPGGPGIRDDSGIYPGYRMLIHYDAMIAKLISWGSDRHEAIRRMTRALREYFVNGIPTTIPFHLRVMQDPRFLSGDFHTGFLKVMPGHEEVSPETERRYREVAVVAAALAYYRRRGGGLPSEREQRNGSAWKDAARLEGLR